MTILKLGFFIHHQGAGHIRRCEAIIRHLRNCEIAIFCAAPDKLSVADLAHVTVHAIPDMIGKPSQGSHFMQSQATPEALHCVPLGVPEMRETMGAIADWMRKSDPHLLFIDVSAEIALLARILGVPAVKTRMHGSRNDPGHSAAYQACAGLLAPYDEKLEQDDYPVEFREKTHYTGGFSTSTLVFPTKAEARKKLKLDPDQEIIVVLSGAGGMGAHYASLTLGARAFPNAQWLVVGPTYKEGHETDFANLIEMGWVKNPADYLAAADVIISSAGDNTVHEVLQLGKPYLCFPEWRYFDEQTCKGAVLARQGAAVVPDAWPGDLETWQKVLVKAKTLSPDRQLPLHNPDADYDAAEYLTGLACKLWGVATPENYLDGKLTTQAVTTKVKNSVA